MGYCAGGAPAGGVPKVGGGAGGDENGGEGNAGAGGKENRGAVGEENGGAAGDENGGAGGEGNGKGQFWGTMESEKGDDVGTVWCFVASSDFRLNFSGVCGCKTNFCEFRS